MTFLRKNVLIALVALGPTVALGQTGSTKFLPMDPVTVDSNWTARPVCTPPTKPLGLIKLPTEMFCGTTDASKIIGKCFNDPPTEDYPDSRHFPCMNKELGRAERQMNLAYRELLKNTKKKEHRRFIENSQRLWIRFKHEQCKFMYVRFAEANWPKETAFNYQKGCEIHLTFERKDYLQFMVSTEREA